MHSPTRAYMDSSRRVAEMRDAARTYTGLCAPNSGKSFVTLALCRLPWLVCPPPGGLVMPDNPITRLTFIRDEVDRTFGEGYSAAHPDIVCAMLASAASDHAACILAHALSDIAAALVVDDS